MQAGTRTVNISVKPSAVVDLVVCLFDEDFRAHIGKEWVTLRKLPFAVREGKADRAIGLYLPVGEKEADDIPGQSRLTWSRRKGIKVS